MKPPHPPRAANVRKAGGLMRPIWLCVGVLSLVLGAVGVVLPLLPTTPLVLLAAFAFSKSSPRLRAWLLAHRGFGPVIRDWERSGAIARRYKAMACGAMAVVLGISLLAGVPGFVLLVQGVFIGAAALFILTRPSSPT